MGAIDFTKQGIALIAFAERSGYSSAVALLEGFIDDSLVAPHRYAVRVLLAGADPEDVQEWLDENE